MLRDIFLYSTGQQQQPTTTTKRYPMHYSDATLILNCTFDCPRCFTHGLGNYSSGNSFFQGRAERHLNIQTSSKQHPNVIQLVMQVAAVYHSYLLQTSQVSLGDLFQLWPYGTRTHTARNTLVCHLTLSPDVLRQAQRFLLCSPVSRCVPSLVGPFRWDSQLPLPFRHPTIIIRTSHEHHQNITINTYIHIYIFIYIYM